MSSSNRPSAAPRPARPAERYRRGKPLPGTVVSSDDDSDEDQEGAAADEDEDDQVVAPAARPKDLGQQKKMQLNISKDVEVVGGKVRIGGLDEVGRTAEEKAVSSEEDDDGSEEDESEEESSEEESSEEEAPVKLAKPVFVSKRNRDTAVQEVDPDVEEKKREAEREVRKQQANELVKGSVLRELADKEVQEVFPDVDDTDGLDPMTEFQEWKLRELTRLKRDKEARYAREKERREVEERRALPEAVRLKEDLARAEAAREKKKEERGQQVFLQRYHHKGAFYGDDDILKKHDYTAPVESAIVDMSSLPKAMQNRNFGKASQSKYTHLKDQDTSRPDAGWARKDGGPRREVICFSCGGPHMRKDCPNAPPEEGAQPAPGGSRDMGWSQRAPRREREDDDRRRRSRSRERERGERDDKRRRL